MADAAMQPCDALRIALLTRDGAEIRHWLDDGSLVMVRCAKDALRIRALVRSEGLTCATYAARLDDAGGAVSCAALHEPRCGVASSLEVLLGFESGMVGTWVADLSGALLA